VRQVAGLTKISAASFVVFAVSTAPLMTRLGTIGLILANCAGMAVRVLGSFVYIRDFFGGLGGMMLHPMVAAAFCVSFAVGFASDRRTDIDSLAAVGRHVAMGVACLAGVVGTVFVFEKPFLKQLMMVRRMVRTGHKAE
jgi:hypothetical protein